MVRLLWTLLYLEDKCLILKVTARNFPLLRIAGITAQQAQLLVSHVRRAHMVPPNSLALRQNARVVNLGNFVLLMASTKHLATVLQDISADKMHLSMNLQIVSLVSTDLLQCTLRYHSGLFFVIIML